ncbi:uncharacterized protein F5Z01DRAFT_667628 [Emericellopsis atlantica]|uniref:Protein kinase domain-containing protein n=1 Tax=Emericellopsis atlantica TaxID=2614577 RepID=A0A9P8CLU2_9HYPO|nr:uncharacterized protein F5Z01DRAFT_667628 [Emericellopsis atlantica]KAG9249961.1 hypothetical protein F5Z01DRAFT_667628 [Emericellopsis atlantica]
MEAGADIVDVYQIHGGDGDGADIIFNFNGKRIAVSVFPSYSAGQQNQNSVQNRLIHLMDRIATGDVEDDEYDDMEDEILEIILNAGRPVFKAQTTPQIESKTSRDLHGIIYPATSHFQLLGSSENAFIAPIKASEAYTLSADDSYYQEAEELELGIDLSLPWYSSRAILCTEVFVEGSGQVASLVLVEDAEMFCKALGSAGGLIGTSVGREMGCLQDIYDRLPPQHNATIHIPHLLGYVRHADTYRIIGFLRQWIPGQRLREMDVPKVSFQRRRKWHCQIRQAVRALHSKGIVWGDGKASNVIVDEHDDAWLVDFGGGWTEGWVSEELADTMEGDEQAIRRIGQFLQLN